jgi:hypothetical protein
MKITLKKKKTKRKKKKERMNPISEKPDTVLFVHSIHKQHEKNRVINICSYFEPFKRLITFEKK